MLLVNIYPEQWDRAALLKVSSHRSNLSQNLSYNLSLVPKGECALGKIIGSLYALLLYLNKDQTTALLQPIFGIRDDVVLGS